MSLTISGHAHREALLEAAVLAAVPVHAHDETLLVLHAHLVVDVLLNAASEETLEKERDGDDEEEKTDKKSKKKRGSACCCPT